ncbi:MAG: peptidase [Pseudomonadota bacterium]
MTYCLAIKIEKGLVFCSDSRTNAGVDRVSTFSKMHLLGQTDDRFLMLLAAGNLATTQAVVDTVARDVKEQNDGNINQATYLDEVADYIGQISLSVQNKYAPAGEEASFNAGASFILGGQIGDDSPELYLIYPEGNHIRTSKEFPFFQVGETKYGKPILDRIIEPSTTPEIAMRCALVSMDSTLRSNVTVGPPIELLFFQAGNYVAEAPHRKFPQHDPYLVQLRESWNAEIVSAFNNLPGLSAAFSDSL